MSGFTLEARQQLMAWPDGPRLFERFQEMPGVLRSTDLPAYVDALGYSADLMPEGAFQVTPVHHQGRKIGTFFSAVGSAGSNSPTKTKSCW